MISPSPPPQEDGTTAPAVEAGEGQQSPMSHASSETAAAVPPQSTETEAGVEAAPANGKRSAPTSPDRMEEDTTEDAAASANMNGQEKPTEDEPSDDAEAAKPPAKKRTICGVCNKEPSKYKCPSCSVACNRIHRDNHPPDAPAEEKKSTLPSASSVSSLPPKPTPPPHPFQVLDDAPELKYLFEKYPTLPDRLKKIYEATQPPAARGSGSANKPNIPGLPARLPNNHSKGGRGGRNNNEIWTKEKGLREGQKALRRARVDPSEEGDAVRAYCELVTHLLAREAEGATSATSTDGANIPNGGGGDVTALVREELADEANQVIKKLLDTEGRQ
ncbi:hypothetical protein Sste5344_001383 [Sporothrix stenoceras]